MHYQFDFGALLPYWQSFLSGALTTIEITVFSVIIGLGIGIACAIARRSQVAVLRAVVGVYIEAVRNTPFIVQIFFIFFGLSSVGIRMPIIAASVFAMVINVGAYTAEIFRAGIEAIPRGQFEGSQALGLNYFYMMVDVILPQAIKIVIPPLTNNCINVMKDTALASVVAMPDLLKQATQAQALAANPTPLIGAALIYIAMLWPLVALVTRLEKRFKAGRR